MYVVGAAKLRSFWEKRTDADAAAALGAFYAMLGEGDWSTSEAMVSAFGEIAEALPDGGIVVNLDWCDARVLMRCNFEAGIVLIDKVTRSEP